MSFGKLSVTSIFSNVAKRPHRQKKKTEEAKFAALTVETRKLNCNYNATFLFQLNIDYRM